MTEFALIAPIMLLMIFGIVDFGRVIFSLVTMDEAVNEAARTAIRAPTPPAPNFFAPTDADALNAARAAAPALFLKLPTCVNGPVDNTRPPANQGWIYITQPTGQPAPPASANAPGGQPPAVASGGCYQVTPAGVTAGLTNVSLQVTIRYNFVPITPLISQVTGTLGVLTAYASYRTEY
jgi:hypothetical protein